MAEASVGSRPIDAADLYRPEVDADLEAGADTRRCPRIAKRLARMKDLHDAAGDPGPFDEYLATIRDTYGRRPSLMRALDDAGL